MGVIIVILTKASLPRYSTRRTAVFPIGPAHPSSLLCFAGGFTTAEEATISRRPSSDPLQIPEGESIEEMSKGE